MLLTNRLYLSLIGFLYFLLGYKEYSLRTVSVRDSR
nr:MAG TPA: hypothetical protein [Caudoviricetes sp.]